MARSRNIKPGFFENAELSELTVYARLLFIGLWTLADREGRLEDRPKQIKFKLMPFDDFDVDATLQQLHDAGFILRYEFEQNKSIQIVNFLKHQTPHCKEKASTIHAPDLHQTCTVLAPPDSLIPDSLIPDTCFLIPDLKPSSLTAEEIAREAEGDDDRKLNLTSFRFLYSDSFGSTMPGGYNQDVNNLCREYSKDKITQAFAIAAKHGAKNLAYVMAVLEERPKGNNNDRSGIAGSTAAARRAQSTITLCNGAGTDFLS